MIPEALQSALVACGFGRHYYELCAEHPLREEPALKCTNAEVLATLAKIGHVSKLKGPGRVYDITAPILHPAVVFSFIIKAGGGVVEPCLGLIENGLPSGTNYAVLAFSANAEMGAPVPSPAYPRPFAYSLAELNAIVTGAFELAKLVGAHLPKQ
jgi:hypothetical protein